MGFFHPRLQRQQAAQVVDAGRVATLLGIMNRQPVERVHGHLAQPLLVGLQPFVKAGRGRKGQIVKEGAAIEINGRFQIAQ